VSPPHIFQRGRSSALRPAHFLRGAGQVTQPLPARPGAVPRALRRRISAGVARVMLFE